MYGHEQLVGRVIDEKYRLDRLIGSGGMGAVYAGTHLQLGRSVAIKILRFDLVADEKMHLRFVREARASARIEHPNAIRVYDFGSLDEAGTYLVMEFAEGVSLRQMLNTQGRLSLELALDLVQQAAAALEAAHSSGVIHRDVKPENLMVCTGADGRPVLKVVDFGIAKVLSSDATTQLTQPTDLIGTPRYMAPEQFTGDSIDGRIDVYALGVVLFEMLTGRAPFDGTFSEIIGKHIYAEPPTLESFGAALPDAVERVVRRALAKSPDDRPQTALDLAYELAEACGPEIAAAVPPPQTYVIQSTFATPVGISADEAATLGTIVAGSPAAIDRLAPEAFITRVAGDEVDEATVVRPSSRFAPRRPSGRVIVPLGTAITSTLSQARETARFFFEPMANGRWAAPAVLALAGCITFGTVAYRESHDVVATPVVQAAEPAPQPSEPVVAKPLATTEAPEEEPASAKRDDDGTPRVEHRRGDAEARAPKDSALKKFGRALRVDRHLRKLF